MFQSQNNRTIKINKFDKHVDITYITKVELFNECNTFIIKDIAALILIIQLQKRIIHLVTQIHLNLICFLNLTLLFEYFLVE